ncbi:cysteine-rich venom protein triflin-like [Anableps anableps]
MSSYQNTWTGAVQAWNDEVHDFRYGLGSISGGVVGHHTQVVWYRSNQIGCAAAYCPNDRPPGNYQLTHPYESGPSCGGCPDACDNKLSSCPELKQQWGCSHSDVASWCPASCRCTNHTI